MPNQMQATIGYYDVTKTIYDNDVEILVHEFEPDAKVKARVKSTGEIIEMEAYLLHPIDHSVFLNGTEFNIRNRVSKYLGYGESEGGSKSSGEPVEESKGKSKGNTPSSKKSKSKASKRDGCD